MVARISQRPPTHGCAAPGGVPVGDGGGESHCVTRGGPVLLDHSEVQVGLQQVPAQRSEPASQPQPELLGTARPSGWARGYSRALGAMETLFAAVAGGSVLATRADGIAASSASFW